MAWIEVHQSLLTHRKTLALADALDIPPVYVLGHVVALWLWSLDNAPDGDLSGLSPRILALAAQWPGDAKVFRQAMVTVGFIDDSEAGSELHDWLDYAGRLAERREKEKERSKARRAASKTEKESKADLATTAGRPSVDLATTAGTGPNRTVPDLTGPTEITAVISAASDSTCEQLQADASSAGTAPDGAAFADAPALSAPKGIVAEFDERLNSEPNKPAVLEDAHVRLFARHAKHGRLGAMAKRHGYGVVLRKMVIAAASWNGVDDPLDYTQKIISGKSGPGPPNGKVNGYETHYLSDEEARKKQQEDEEWTRRYYQNSS